ncbi:hypothetical protein FEZ60_24150 [Rhodococcus sp. MS16]|uniref:hypothetical protein n=1 Tax=Rhodococcus sp. MS16 TaxID=2579941 RepID=UPI001562D1EA|nr:hypothetical protein [Rhodococcus sp. MS16]NRI68613.1 hypothetical protein [Rhodococcus sp. MS16]
MNVLVAVVVIFLAIFGLAIWISVMARKQADFQVKAPPLEVANAVQSHFGSVWWKPVNGDGDLNYQSKGLGLSSWGMDNPIISINIAEMDNGNTDVSAWMSFAASRMGIVSSADRVYLKRRKMIKKLEEMGV